MYICEDFIDLGMEEKWTSEDHKKVACNVCLCNPNVFTLEVLDKNRKIINGIPQEKIKTITTQDLLELGTTI